MADQPHDAYAGRTRLQFLEATLAAIAPMCAKRIEPDEVDAAADLLLRSFHREPEADVADGIDAWVRAVNDPRGLPTSGQIWHYVTEVRRQRTAQDYQTPTDLFGGTAGAGAPLPGYLRELEAKLADIGRVEPPPHRHRPPGPGIDPTEGCLACEAAAIRVPKIDQLLADLPDYQAMVRSSCKGCDGSGWVLDSGPGWAGMRVNAGFSFWARCEHCNKLEDGDEAAR